MTEEIWPLANIRVADLTWWAAGPIAAGILASMGAEVIKVEKRASPDPVRFGAIQILPEGQISSGVRPLGYRDPKFGPNRSGMYNIVNAGKKCVTIDVKNPDGRMLLENLISKSDVVIENFSAEVLERWGLGYDALRKLREDIIYVSMSGMGHSGRKKNYMTMGPNVQALSGLTANSGLPNKPPCGWGYSYMDYIAGYFGAAAVMYALLERKRTGKGQYIDLSQVECGIFLNSLAVLNYQINGQRPEQSGNRSKYNVAAPHGIYRCKGDDEWCSISVLSEEEWIKFCKAIGNPSWTIDFQDLESRTKNQDQLDALVETWTCERSADEVQETLQSNGVKAGRVQGAAQLFDSDPQLKYRGFFVPLENSEIGRKPVFQIPIKSRKRNMRVGGVIQRASPVLGEHNQEIFSDLLGFSQEQLDAFAQKGAI